MLAQRPRDKHCSHAKPTVFCDHGRERNAVNLHAETENEDQVQYDVGEVDREEYQQGYARVLQTEKPADQDVIDERPRRAPDANGKVLQRELLHVRLGPDEVHREVADRCLQGQQYGRKQQRHDNGLAKRHAQSVVVVGAIALRSDTRRAHAQKVQARVDKAEDRGANRHSPEVHGAVEVPCNARIDHAEQRHGHIGQDHWRSNAPDIAIRQRPPGGQTRINRMR